MKKHSDRQPNDVSDCLNNKSIYQQMKLANPSLPPSKFANQFNPCSSDLIWIWHNC